MLGKLDVKFKLDLKNTYLTLDLTVVKNLVWFNTQCVHGLGV